MQQGSTPSPTARRLRWRVVIHAGEKVDPSRGQQSLAWHLAECANPPSPDAHCDVGRRLIATDGNPDGHCLIGGVCPRCEQLAVEESAPAAPAAPAAPQRQPEAEAEPETETDTAPAPEPPVAAAEEHPTEG